MAKSKSWAEKAKDHRHQHHDAERQALCEMKFETCSCVFVFSGNSLSVKSTCCLSATIGSTFGMELLDEAYGSSMAMCRVFCSDS